MKLIRSAPILLFSALMFCQNSGGQIIDFETTPSGAIPVDNAPLSRMTPYIVDGVEVTFGFDNTGDGIPDLDAIFEKVGVDTTHGFQSDFGTQSHDTARPTSTRSLGTFFLRQPTALGVVPGSFVVNYSEDVQALSGEIWDLDASENAYEQWRITAYDALGNQLRTIDTPVGLVLSDPDSRDSLALPFQIKAPGIRRLEIKFIGTSTMVGLAFDNFRATTVSPNPPSLVIETAILLQFESELGEVYSIEESENMQDWTDSVTGIEGDGTELKFFFEITEPRKFYRLKQPE